MKTALWKLALVFVCFVPPIMARAEFQTGEFDRFYHTYFLQPQPDRLNESLDYFVHITNTAGTTLGEKEYRVYVQSRARFFATLMDTNPSLARHAESLFPQLLWAQKTVLLEVFKRTREPGIKTALERWSRSEEDDDRRLLLEQTALHSDAEDTWLMRPISNPASLEEQWALFFATGNTAVINNTFKYATHIEGISNSISVETDVLELEGEKGTLHAQMNTRLNNACLYFVTARKTLLALIQQLQPNQIRTKHEIIEMLAWRCLDTEDLDSLNSLMPILRSLWENQQEKANYVLGALAVLRGNLAEAEAARQKLEAVEPLWAERLKGYQIHCLNNRLQATGHWVDIKAESGILLVNRLIDNINKIKSFRTYEQFRCVSSLISRDELVQFRQQLNVMSDDERTGWQQDGAHHLFWKQSNDRFYLWTEHQKKWVEVRNQQVRERILKAGSLNEWVDFIKRNQPVTYSELQGADGFNWTRLKYMPKIIDSELVWNNASSLGGIQEGDARQISVALDLDTTTGQITHIQIDLGEMSNGAGMQIEKNYYEVQYK